MGGSSGGGSSKSTQTVQQSTISGHAVPYHERILARAEAESNQPYQAYGGPRIANFSGDTLESFDLARSLPSAYNPSFAASQDYMNSAGIAAAGAKYNPTLRNSGYAASAYNPTDFSFRQVDPNGYVQSAAFSPEAAEYYMSPYVSSVLDRQKYSAMRDFNEQANERNSNAITQGAFGGGRQAVMQAVADRGLLDRMSDIEASGRQSAYDAARSQFNTDIGSMQEAQRANIGFGLQAGTANQSADLAAQQAAEASRQFGAQFGDSSSRYAEEAAAEAARFNEGNRLLAAQQELARSGQLGQLGIGALQIGQGIQQTGASQTDLMNSIGQQQQNQTQRNLDLSYEDYLNQRDYDRQNINWFTSIASGSPLNASRDVVSYTPNNQLSQLAGLASAGIGAYREFA